VRRRKRRKEKRKKESTTMTIEDLCKLRTLAVCERRERERERETAASSNKIYGNSFFIAQTWQIFALMYVALVCDDARKKNHLMGGICKLRRERGCCSAAFT
jgi:hypothetical protein